MNIFKKIYRWFFPRKFTHNPEDFIIQAGKSWFSDSWYQIRYSANKGESWKFLYEARKPLYDFDYKTLSEYDWGWGKIAFQPETESFKVYSDKFKSYQDILDFYAEESKKIQEGKVNRQARLEEYRKKIEKNLHGK